MENTPEERLPDYKRLAPEEMQTRISLLKRLMNADGEKLPEYYVQAYAQYFSLSELGGIVHAMRKKTGRIADAFAGAKKSEPGSKQEDPVRLLWDTLKLGTNTRLPPSLDFATLFVDLGRSEGASAKHLIESKLLNRFAVDRKEDFPLAIPRERLFDMMLDPTPEGAKMLISAMHAKRHSNKKLAIIRLAPEVYLAELSPAAAHLEPLPATTVHFIQVGAALQRLRQGKVAHTKDMADGALDRITRLYMHHESHLAQLENRPPVTVNRISLQLLFDGKTRHHIEKNGKIAVILANLLLLPPENRNPAVREILGNAEQFTDVTQLEALGKRILKEKTGNSR